MMKLGLSAEDLARRLDELDLSPRERAATVGDLVERCRQNEADRSRYLMRFVTLLADEAPAVRGWAIVGVVLCDERGEHVERLLRLLEDPSPGVRLQVLHALGPLGLTEHHDRFAACLRDPDRLVRMAAAVALASGGDFRGTDVLIDAAQRRDTRLDALYALRRAAAEAPELHDRIEAMARKLYGGLLTHRFDRVGAAALLASMGHEDARGLLVERAGKRTVERPMALELCGELRIPGGEALVARVATDPKDPLRGTALRALGSYRAAGAEEVCGEVLLNPAEDPDVRCDAAEGLLLSGSEEARRVLERASQEIEDERVRGVAATSLSLFGRSAREVRLYLPLTGEEVMAHE